MNLTPAPGRIVKSDPSSNRLKGATGTTPYARWRNRTAVFVDTQAVNADAAMYSLVDHTPWRASGCGVDTTAGYTFVRNEGVCYATVSAALQLSPSISGGRLQRQPRRCYPPRVMAKAGAMLTSSAGPMPPKTRNRPCLHWNSGIARLLPNTGRWRALEVVPRPSQLGMSSWRL